MLCTRAFGSEEFCCPHLEEVSTETLKKCAGLPLAIITVSSLLADQHAKGEWNSVLTAIGSALAKYPDDGNMTKILSSLYMSPQSSSFPPALVYQTGRDGPRGRRKSKEREKAAAIRTPHALVVLHWLKPDKVCTMKGWVPGDK